MQPSRLQGCGSRRLALLLRRMGIERDKKATAVGGSAAANAGAPGGGVAAAGEAAVGDRL